MSQSLQLLGIGRLPHLGGPHHPHVVEIALGDFILIVLVQHLAEHFAVAHGLTGDSETQILRCLFLHLVDDTDAEADRPQAIGGTCTSPVLEEANFRVVY